MKHFLAIIVAVIAVIGLTVAGSASARPALASVTTTQPLPANFSKLPASWHGYAPPVNRAAAVKETAAVACSDGEAIYNRNSALVLEVYDSSTADGGIVDQWAYNGTQTQHWCFIQTSTYQGSIPVYEIINNNSGMCLDLPNDNLADGQHLQQWQCVGDEQQQWIWFNDGLYDTIAPFTASNSNQGFLYVMEVYGSSTGNGGEVDIWTGDATPTQEWCPGTHCTAPGSTELCVDSSGDGNQCILEPSTLGTDAFMNYVDLGDDMRWTYPGTGQTGAIVSYDGTCLQVNAAGGYTVQNAACVGDAAEMWTNRYNSNFGRTEFVSVYDPDLCLAANYTLGITEADYCILGGIWFEEWGTS